MLFQTILINFYIDFSKIWGFRVKPKKKNKIKLIDINKKHLGKKNYLDHKKLPSPKKENKKKKNKLPRPKKIK